MPFKQVHHTLTRLEEQDSKASRLDVCLSRSFTNNNTQQEEVGRSPVDQTKHGARCHMSKGWPHEKELRLYYSAGV